jgi:hypothetical protein
MEKAALKSGFFFLNGLNEIGTSRGSVLTRRDTGRGCSKTKLATAPFSWAKTDEIDQGLWKTRDVN